MGKFNLIVLSKKSAQKYSLQLSGLFPLMILMFFAVVLLATVLSLSGVSILSRQGLELQTTLQDMENQKGKLLNKQQEAALYRRWSENIIFKQFNFTDVSGRGYDILPEIRREGEIDPADDTPGRVLIDVDNFSVNRFNLALDFDCHLDLINRQAGRKTLSGYFFILARNDEVIPEIYRLWPGGDIKAGRPKDYTQGDSFSIRYLKKIKARITQPDIGPRYNRVDLIAYSEEGELLMNKGYYIEKSLMEYPLE